ncbi:hypothetical protein ABT187_37960 [Streptomyces sp. NPDC001817]|uniref:hypothetical protein n=1 Tax=Streptomyces sp. NPDC001817 TaxID=3154398 RepID=UPI00331E19C8
MLAATLCACVVEVLAVRQLRLWSFRHPGRPVWLPFHHALLVLVCLVAARSLPRLLRHPLVGRCAVPWCGAETAWGVLADERRYLISVFGLVVLLLVRRHPVMRPRVPVIVVVCGLTDFVGVAGGHHMAIRYVGGGAMPRATPFAASWGTSVCVESAVSR